MEQTFRSSSQQVTDTEVASALLDTRSRLVLSAFLTPTSLSAAARDLGRPLNTVKYQWQKLRRLGLLKMVCDGRPPLYQAEGESFFIPYELTPAHWPQDMLQLLHTEWNRRMDTALLSTAEDEARRHGVWGMQVRRQENALTLEHAAWSAGWNFTRPQAPAVLDLLGELSLDFEQAKALQRDLLQLLAQYRRKPGSQPHLIRLTLTPASTEKAH